VSKRVEELLRRVPLYHRLGPVDGEHLAALSSVRSYARGERIFVEGQTAEVFFMIVDGRVKVVKSTKSGKDIILEIFGPGDPLGTVAVYEDRPYPATAVALEPTTCVATGKRTFYQLLERRPSLVRGLLSAMTLRLVELTNRLAEGSEGRVETRFARFFLKLSEDLGVPRAEGVFIPMALTRQELGDFMCTTVETSIRVMSRWGREKIVRTDRDGFQVLDTSALRDLAAR